MAEITDFSLATGIRCGEEPETAETIQVVRSENSLLEQAVTQDLVRKIRQLSRTGGEVIIATAKSDEEINRIGRERREKIKEILGRESIRYVFSTVYRGGFYLELCETNPFTRQQTEKKGEITDFYKYHPERRVQI